MSDAEALANALRALGASIAKLVSEELRPLLAPDPPPRTTPPPRLTLDELAHAEACSRATIRRLVAEGAPVHYLGSSPRFDLIEWRSWCEARGRKGTAARRARPSGPIAGVRLLSRGTR